MGKRLQTKLLLVTAVLLASGALVASTGVTAQALQSCTTSNGYTLAPAPDTGGNWPIPTTSTSGGVALYEWRYTITPSTGINNIQVALNNQIKVVQKSNGTSEDPNLQRACLGGTGNNAMGVAVCDVRVYVWTTTTGTTRSFYTPRTNNNHAPDGGCAVRKGISANTALGFPLEVPVPTPPEFASVIPSEVVNVDGVPYCIPLGPNGCPTGQPPFLCSNPNQTLPQVDLTILDSNNNPHKPVYFQGTAENAACTRGQFFLNAKCHVIYVGGTTYSVCS